VETELQQWQPEQQQQDEQQTRARFPQMADYPDNSRPPTPEDVFIAYYEGMPEATVAGLSVRSKADQGF
jgi:hypothetical protein